MSTQDLERSTYQNRPAYRYIRASDNLPTEPVGNNPVCKVKLFNPTGSGTWWIASYNPETRIAYGVANIHETEAGDFSMQELTAFRGRFGLPIERDLHYTPKTMAEVAK